MTIQEFAKLLTNGQPEIGSYDIGFYDADGNHMETELDVHVGDTLKDFYQLVENDLLEADADLDDIDYVAEVMPDTYLCKELWKELMDVLVDERGYLLESFNGFVAGKHTRFDVWQNLEERFGIIDWATAERWFEE